MRTTLDLDDDVLSVARELARAGGQSLGAIVSELIRRGLAPARIDAEGELPVIRVPAGTPPLTPALVSAADGP